jgi:hypothetical protein
MPSGSVYVILQTVSNTLLIYILRETVSITPHQSFGRLLDESDPFRITVGLAQIRRVALSFSKHDDSSPVVLSLAPSISLSSEQESPCGRCECRIRVLMNQALMV